MDWIGECAGAAWGIYTVETNTMPRAYDYTAGGYRPSALLTGEAQVTASPRQVVTYHLNPAAVWSNGQPITSQDFRYTWDQIAHGTNIYDAGGYDHISSVDTPDPHTAVVTFSQVVPDWKVLFGGSYGVLPSRILQSRDRDATMKDGYTWSGGPWKLDHWTKGSEIVLVPNPAYWGEKPNLDRVTFRFVTDTDAESALFRSGSVSAMYPQAQPGQQDLRGQPNTFFDAVTGLSFEALWFNVDKAPLNDANVRKALAFATDRDAIVSQLFASIEPGIKPVQSSFTPAFGSVYTEPFAPYKRDQDQVNHLMATSGYARGTDGIWAKGGQKAALEVKTTAGNQRRALTTQMLQSQWQAAGFQLTVTTERAGTLFGTDLPAGNFQISIFAQVPTDNDPGQCTIWCSKNIPGPANGNTGQNFDRVNDAQLDQLWTSVDGTIDDSARISAAQKAESRLAELVPFLPLDPFPDIVVVNIDKIGTASGSFQHNLAYGPFAYLNSWYAK